jgi:hypothetical protein
MFCKKGGKVDRSSICSTALFPKRWLRMAKQMQARHPDHGNPLQKAPKLPWTKKPTWCSTSAPSLPPYPATSHTRHRPTGLYPLQLIPGGDRAHVPFRVSEHKEIKKDLGNYIENPDQYIQTF